MPPARLAEVVWHLLGPGASFILAWDPPQAAAQGLAIHQFIFALNYIVRKSFAC